MAAAVAFRQPLLPAAASRPPPSLTSHPSNDSLSSESKPSQKSSVKASRGRKERPCDACRRKKSKCVMESQANACVACAAHGQQCTFVEDPRPRKRRLETDGKEANNLGKRRSVNEMQTPSNPQGAVKIKRESSDGSRADTPANHWQYQGTHMGYTTELDPILFDVSPSEQNIYQKSDRRNAFLIHQQGTTRNRESQARIFQSIDQIIGSQGPALVQHFRTINRSLPIIEDAFLETHNSSRRHSLDPALLCAIYVVAAASGAHEMETARWQNINIGQLEEMAFALFDTGLANPTLPTIQTGLLLMQRSEIDTKYLNTQLVAAAFEIGLHLDCSAWPISTFERGLRKRLAWALYMEDQWCSLTHGRPALISKVHWAVNELEEEDFETIDKHQDSPMVAELKLGRDCFCQMVALTEILSSILETLYTQKAMLEFDEAGENGTRLVLSKAKPIQVTLKEWFTRLPKELKMDNGQAPATIGHLHLAYFATEITLHRCIIRTLSSTPSPPSSDIYLTHVCRSAAKARLISAMEFVNRLRPIHLTSFWYFPSRVNFALIATFGSLLLATAPCQEEVDFYKARLSEYGWALSVSAKSAGFLAFALESLESSTGLLKDMPSKPKLDELDVPLMLPPPRPNHIIPPPSPPTNPMTEADFEDDDTMEDVTIDGSIDASTDVQSLPISIPQSGAHHIPDGLMSPGSSAWSAPASFAGGRDLGGGPYIGPFAGLGAPNWFDQEHHGSPEAERMSLWAS